jgi:hypothetical protein
MWKEVAVARFKALSHYLNEQTQKAAEMSAMTVIISLIFEPGISEAGVLPSATAFSILHNYLCAQKLGQLDTTLSVPTLMSWPPGINNVYSVRVSQMQKLRRMQL